MKQTVVLKIGTSSICHENTHFPKLSSLSLLVETVVELINDGYKVILVTSGAVGVGLRRMSFDKRPKHLSQVQAVAAVGQGRLMSLYDQMFSNYDIPIAQILLTRENLADRAQYLNACNTLKELLQMNVVPIINENDTVSNAEIRFGDNDTLSAIAASMVNADFLFLMTDVDAMYTDNPKRNPDVKRIRVVKDIMEIRKKVNVSSSGSSLGTGGMMTKLVAAELATAMGCHTFITLGSLPKEIPAMLKEFIIYQKDEDDKVLSRGTLFLAKEQKMVDRKFWIRHGLSPNGSIFVDSGAVESIIKHKKSLFAAGIVRVEGNFASQQSVTVKTIILNATGQEETIEVGRGLTNYSGAEINRVAGMKSKEIADALGYMDTEWIIHRDNLVVSNDDIPFDKITLLPKLTPDSPRKKSHSSQEDI